MCVCVYVCVYVRVCVCVCARARARVCVSVSVSVSVYVWTNHTFKILPNQITCKLSCITVTDPTRPTQAFPLSDSLQVHTQYQTAWPNCTRPHASNVVTLSIPVRWDSIKGLPVTLSARQSFLLRLSPRRDS